VNFHEPGAPQVLGGETMIIAGKGSSLDVLGLSTHKATFGSFVQAHRGQTSKVHQRVLDAVTGSRIFDLYGGSGSIALALAARGKHVLMVESFRPATERALEAAREGKLSLVVECADVGDALIRLAKRERFDCAVVNPPRRGLDPKVRERLALLDLATVVYVSCKPETRPRLRSAQTAGRPRGRPGADRQDGAERSPPVSVCPAPPRSRGRLCSAVAGRQSGSSCTQRTGTQQRRRASSNCVSCSSSSLRIRAGRARETGIP
jgi:hypothetical protein